MGATTAATRRISVDGCSLAYEVNGCGPPVVLIQGVGVHGSGWRPQVEALQSHYTCLTFDNRGIGSSQPASPDLSVTRMAEDVRSVMDAAGWDRAHIVGHSLGGLVALFLASAHRHRVQSLALLCTFANGRAAAPMTPRMVWYGIRSRVGTKPMRRAGFLRLISAGAPADPPAEAARLADLFGHDLAEQPAAVPRQLQAMRAADATSFLPSLRGLPALVVCGRHDPIAPPSLARTMRDGIPGARFFEVPGASHGLPITHASTVNALLDEHFRGCGASPACGV